MPLLFSYGTLQEERVQLATFGRLLRGEHDELAGYERGLVPIVDADELSKMGRTHYDNAVFNGKSESRIDGTVFEVTDAELAAADAYEAPANYERVLVSLASGTEAWVYAWRTVGTARRSRPGKRGDEAKA